MPEIEEVVFELKIREVSNPVEVDTGVFIFKLKEKTAAVTAGLEEVKDYIHNLLFQKAYNERREEWLKEIRKDAYIEIK